MIWIVASLPFWIIGMFVLMVAIFGTGVTIRDVEILDEPKFKRAVYTAGALYLASGMFLLLAAKICS